MDDPETGADVLKGSHLLFFSQDYIRSVRSWSVPSQLVLSLSERRRKISGQSSDPSFVTTFFPSSTTLLPSFLAFSRLYGQDAYHITGFYFAFARDGLRCMFDAIFRTAISC